MRRVHTAAVLTASLALLAGSLGAGAATAVMPATVVGTSSVATPAPAAVEPTPPAGSTAPDTAPSAEPAPAPGTEAPATQTQQPAAREATRPGATAPAATERARRAPGGRGKAPDRYTPSAGVRYNNPLGSAANKRKLISHLIRSINSTPRGEEIRIASWNIRSTDIAAALIAAHNRGVSVQAVMDRLNANASNPNVGINRMVAAFARNKANRPKDRRSSVVKCLSSCRSTSGIAHTKFFLFSKAGKAKDVVMYGSNNATDLAAYGQWNDLYTVRDDAAIYAEFDAVFDEMRKDKPRQQPYVAYDHGKLTTYFYPYRGEGATTDPVLDDLNKVQCAGATGGTGTGGNTKIRIAQTAVLGQRGLAIANKLRTLYEQGCDIRIVYAVLGNQVLSVVRNTSRGAIPLRQIAQDFNLDGVYDRYLHMKTMTISGVYDGNTAEQVTFNGSANWTAVGLASDEILGKIYGGNVTRKYAKWFDTLFRNPPRFTGRAATLATVARMSALSRGVSPESGIELN